MNPYQKSVITIVGLGLAIFVFIETQVLYSGETIPVVTFQSSTGTEFTLISRDGALAIKFCEELELQRLHHENL